jgi:hypothetical protein
VLNTNQLIYVYSFPPSKELPQQWLMGYFIIISVIYLPNPPLVVQNTD